MKGNKRWIGKGAAVLAAALVLAAFSGCGGEAGAPKPAAASSAVVTAAAGERHIVLNINGKPFPAVLNGTPAAESLYRQLPMKVTLNDSDNDFCGDSIDITYTPRDVQKGYKNGDIAYWTPAKNFVIFRSGEETSGDTGNIVNLGRIENPADLSALSGTLTVEISRAEK